MTPDPKRPDEILLLAFETSCDETSLALLQGEREVVASLVSSQVELHAEYGGVVPELAARRHLEQINPLLQELFDGSGYKFEDVGAVCATTGPGLVIALLVGVSAARAFAFARDVPIIGVNHLEGHVEAAFLVDPGLRPPVLAHIISGGHTILAAMKDHGEYKILGETLDDAVGEAFDKVAAYLELGYPGGPVIDRLAAGGDPTRYELPRAMVHSGDYNFSLSGVKTAVRRLIEIEEKRGGSVALEDVCASFQAAVFDVQIEKGIRAASDNGLDKIVLAGGVAANSYLRRVYAEKCSKAGMTLYAPPMSLCGDNAAMIAAAGYRKYLMQEFLAESMTVDPNMRLGNSYEAAK